MSVRPAPTVESHNHRAASASKRDDEFTALCTRLETEARWEAEKAGEWERRDRWATILLLVGSAGFSAAGSAIVFADLPTVGAILAGDGGLAAAINAAVRPGERQTRQLQQRADLLRVADEVQLLRSDATQQAEARESALAALIRDLAEIRRRGFVAT